MKDLSLLVSKACHHAIAKKGRIRIVFFGATMVS